MKKIARKILLAIVLTPPGLLIAGTIAYMLYSLLAVGGESTVHQDYLKKNMETIRPGASNQFGLFDAAFYANKIFLLGEAHGFAMPQELDYELLQHLSQKAGVRHYLAEADYSQAHFLNEYLQTGDEQLLAFVFSTWVRMNAQWGNKNFYDKIRRIRALNQSLPPARRIRIVGVDKIQDAAVTHRFLQQLRQQAGFRAEIAPRMDTLMQLIASGNEALAAAGAVAGKLLKEIKEDTKEDTLSQSGAVREDFPLIHTLRNLTYYNPNTNRDSVMFLNLKAVTRAFGLENEKLYGLWGFFHTLQIPMKREHRITPFAAHIKNEASPFRNKVVSLNIYALDSENMMPGKQVPAAIGKGKPYFNTSWGNSDGPLVFVNGIEDLKAVTRENSITIFRLAGQNSPYLGSPKLAQVKVLIPGQSLTPDNETEIVTAAFQYAVLIRNSKALEPLSEQPAGGTVND